MGVYARSTKSSPVGVRQPIAKSDTPGRGWRKTAQERKYDATRGPRQRTYARSKLLGPKAGAKGYLRLIERGAKGDII